MKFYLGTHQPHWLWTQGHTDGIPLFVSRRRLAGRKTFGRAMGDWALDSGGFTELSMHGTWTISPAQYVEEVRQYRDCIGRLDWAAIQDWMCEPHICANTFPSLSHAHAVEWHQALTVTNYGELLARAPDVKWTPVLQGWTYRDYLEHLDLYTKQGFDLSSVPVVGLGSVCRRQDTSMVERLIQRLHAMGIRIHGFGFKATGLRATARLMASADSMAWSYSARRADPLPECTHANCANCARYAVRWYHHVMQTASIDALQCDLESLLC